MLRILAVAIVLMLHALPASAEVVVVVNARNGIDRLSRQEVVNIFMGRYRKFPDGATARPLDMNIESAERRIFYKKLLDKNLDEINAYWARLVFSGRTSPPAQSKSREQLLTELASDPNAIAYIDRKDLGANVKVVYSLPE